MLTIGDLHTDQPFEPCVDLGPKRRRLLEESWAGVFRHYLLAELPVQELSPHFCQGFGRPSKDLFTVLGALILQQLHDLTDQQTVEALAFNIAWHYVLDIRVVRRLMLLANSSESARRARKAPSAKPRIRRDKSA